MIYLGGGGSEVDEANIWDLAFKAGQRVVIWPFAMPSTRWQGTQEWVTKSLARFGDFASISLGLQGPDFGLHDADIVVIPGGNTFRLLDHLQRNGLLPALRNFLDNGGRIYGGSAGALILGTSVAITDSSVGGQDDNIIADLRGKEGLNVLGGCVSYPHFGVGADNFEGHCHRWSQEHNVTVIGMPETCGLQFDPSGRALNAGPSPAHVFTPDGQRTVWAPNTTLSFPL
ncbi:hypothetical protein NLG97_g2171 [Lecanicillium saksenae]|uniref:Uncharacterized protein n=1 Tax=Lecanicillium saksenae TaxID=468837 RepID=A0ACC1R3I5_9HYPO|nr:hypothetical protein NLG97_g2171 [Lecanicillium saksenae]